MEKEKRTGMKYIIVLLVSVCFFLPMRGQEVGLKTNLLYLATTTPNLGVEWGLDRHYSVSLSVGYNPFRFSSYKDEEGSRVNPKLSHWLVSAESKYWFCETFLGWNIGVHLFSGEYNVTGFRWIHPLGKGRYKGWGAGIGGTVGYQFPLSERWSLDFSLGMGYAYTRYTKYDCYACGDKQGKYKKNYLGPTKAVVSVVYFLK